MSLQVRALEKELDRLRQDMKSKSEDYLKIRESIKVKLLKIEMDNILGLCLFISVYQIISSFLHNVSGFGCVMGQDLQGFQSEGSTLI